MGATSLVNVGATDAVKACSPAPDGPPPPLVLLPLRPSHTPENGKPIKSTIQTAKDVWNFRILFFPPSNHRLLSEPIRPRKGAPKRSMWRSRSVAIVQRNKRAYDIRFRSRKNRFVTQPQHFTAPALRFGAHISSTLSNVGPKGYNVKPAGTALTFGRFRDSVTIVTKPERKSCTHRDDRWGQNPAYYLGSIHGG
jgi:hypothetical protein